MHPRQILGSINAAQLGTYCVLANLRRNLYKGGVSKDILDASFHFKLYISEADPEAIQILVNNDTPTSAQDSTNLAPGGTSDAASPQLTRVPEPPTAYGISPSYHNENVNKYANYGNHMVGHTSKAVEYRGQFEDICSPNEGQDGYFNNSNNRTEVGRDGQFLRNAKRTIQLSNLPEAATHADVTDAVKGGMLLDVFLRSQDRAASISFLDGNAANDFFRYAKRNDLYIRGKRVSVDLHYFANTGTKLTRSRFRGLTVTSPSQTMSPIRLEWVQREISLFDPQVLGTRMSLSGKIWTISTT